MSFINNSMNNLINSGEQAFKDFDTFFNMLTQEDTLDIELNVTSSEYNGAPELTIHIDGNKLESRVLAEGAHTLHISYPVKDKKSVHIEISMQGKNPRDTHIINGQIVKDKYILIDHLLINKFDLTADPNLFYNKLRYTDNQGNTDTVKNGFWHNSTLHIECTLPFSVWYQTNTTRNIDLSNTLVYQDDKNLAEQQYNKLVGMLHLLK